MSILRVMTYGFKGDHATDIAVAAQMIRLQRPELIFLQQLNQPQVLELSAETGLDPYLSEGHCAFLSRYKLSALRYHALGGDGECLQADLTLSEKRIHLFNLQLVTDPAKRGMQLDRLFSDDLLEADLPCAKLVGGDFSLPLWGGGQWKLRNRLKKTPYPSWGANYPAVFPLWPRDGFYLDGPLRGLAGQVVSTLELKKISRHLPVINTLELLDNRQYLKLPQLSDRRMRPAEG